MLCVWILIGEVPQLIDRGAGFHLPEPAEQVEDIVR